MFFTRVLPLGGAASGLANEVVPGENAARRTIMWSKIRVDGEAAHAVAHVFTHNECEVRGDPALLVPGSVSVLFVLAAFFARFFIFTKLPLLTLL